MTKSAGTLNGNQGGGKKYCNSCGGNGNEKIVKPIPATQFALNGRAASHQHIEVIHLQQSSTHPSGETNGLANVGGTTHPLNFTSLQFVQERSQSVPRQNGGTSSTGNTSPTNISNNSPCELKVRNNEFLILLFISHKANLFIRVFFYSRKCVKIGHGTICWEKHKVDFDEMLYFHFYLVNKECLILKYVNEI
jgi:hypothetical protein